MKTTRFLISLLSNAFLLSALQAAEWATPQNNNNETPATQALQKQAIANRIITCDHEDNKKIAGSFIEPLFKVYTDNHAALNKLKSIAEEACAPFEVFYAQKFADHFNLDQLAGIEAWYAKPARKKELKLMTTLASEVHFQFDYELTVRLHKLISPEKPLLLPPTIQTVVPTNTEKYIRAFRLASTMEQALRDSGSLRDTSTQLGSKFPDYKEKMDALVEESTQALKAFIINQIYHHFNEEELIQITDWNSSTLGKELIAFDMQLIPSLETQALTELQRRAQAVPELNELLQIGQDLWEQKKQTSSHN
jgi:hypothetical protein